MIKKNKNDKTTSNSLLPDIKLAKISHVIVRCLNTCIPAMIVDYSIGYEKEVDDNFSTHDLCIRNDTLK